jgi:hypothetical protein
MKQASWSLGGALVAVLAASVSGAPAQDAGAANVLLTVTVGDTRTPDGPSAKVFRLTTQSGGAPARMLMGFRMPVPTSRKPAEDAAGSEVDYVYQNVGFSADLQVSLMSGARALVGGSLELSGPRNAPAGSAAADGLPVIGTFQHELSVVLQAGKALRIAEAPDPEGGMLYVELEFRVLD